jgi:PhnB protein
MKLNTYLNYGGNCEQAFRFYEQHLGGKITMMVTHGQQPNPNVSPEWKNAILHARIDLGETELMSADIPPERFQPIRSAYLSLRVDSDRRG